MKTNSCNLEHTVDDEKIHEPDGIKDTKKKKKHSKKKPYRCTLCGKVFIAPSHLEIHKRTLINVSNVEKPLTSHLISIPIKGSTMNKNPTSVITVRKNLLIHLIS